MVHLSRKVKNLYSYNVKTLKKKVEELNYNYSQELKTKYQCSYGKRKITITFKTALNNINTHRGISPSNLKLYYWEINSKSSLVPR